MYHKVRPALHRVVHHHRHPATVPVPHHPAPVAQALNQARNSIIIIHFSPHKKKIIVFFSVENFLYFL